MRWGFVLETDIHSDVCYSQGVTAYRGQSLRHRKLEDLELQY